MDRLSRHFRLLLAGPVLVVLLAMALFSGVLAPADPLRINARNTLKSPSAQHVLGTDQLGRFGHSPPFEEALGRQNPCA